MRIGDEQCQPADERLVAGVRDAGISKVRARALIQLHQLVELIRRQRPRLARLAGELGETEPGTLVPHDEGIDVHVTKVVRV